MNHYRRRLPHRDIPGVPAFVTWRLWGSLPRERVFLPEHLTSGQVFVAWDRLLDTARSGPRYLAQPEIAEIVSEELRKVVANNFCEVHAYVVMPNHVHVLWTPAIAHFDLIRRVKGATACQGNKRLGRTGEQFWQQEYFDRAVRTDKEFARIHRYIEWNPVKAGLTARPEEFPWSSAYAGVRVQLEGGL